MPYLSPADINAFFCLVAQRVASSPKVGIKDPEFKSIAEIRSEIASTKGEILSLLDTFLSAYKVWYAVHEEIESSCSVGNLSAAQSAKLHAAISARDNSREALLRAISA